MSAREFESLMSDIRPSKEPVDSDISPFRPTQPLDVIDNFNVASKLDTISVDLVDVVTILSGKFVARLYQPPQLASLYQEFTTHVDLHAFDELMTGRAATTLGSRFDVARVTFQNLHVTCF